MIAGRFVFRGLADWQKIKQLEYSFPEGFDEQAQDLVQKLLVNNHVMADATPSPRYGRPEKEQILHIGITIFFIPSDIDASSFSLAHLFHSPVHYIVSEMSGHCLR